MWYSMKKWIHPKYFKNVKVTCICGNTFEVNATVEGPIKVEACRECNPFFNNNKVVTKVVKGMMERYNEKMKRIEAAQKKAA